MKFSRYTIIYIALLAGAIVTLFLGAFGWGRDGCRELYSLLSCNTRLSGIDLYAEFVFLCSPIAAVYINWRVNAREIVAQKIAATGRPAWHQYAIIYLIGIPVAFGGWLLSIFYTWEPNQNAGGQLVGLANTNALAFAIFAPAAAFWLVFMMSACLIYIVAPFQKS